MMKHMDMNGVVNGVSYGTSLEKTLNQRSFEKNPINGKAIQA